MVVKQKRLNDILSFNRDPAGSALFNGLVTRSPLGRG